MIQRVFLDDCNSAHYDFSMKPNSTFAQMLIKLEIEWCENNPMPEKITDEYRKGFIKGLEQALFLLRKSNI